MNQINQTRCPSDARIYTPQELAELWRCSLGMVYSMLREGKLVGFKLGRDWRITEDAIRAYEQAPENQSPMSYQKPKPENDRRRSRNPPASLRVV